MREESPTDEGQAFPKRGSLRFSPTEEGLLKNPLKERMSCEKS